MIGERKLRHKSFVVWVMLTVWVVSGAGAREVGIEQGWLRIEAGEQAVITNADAERGVEIALALQRFRSVFARLAPSIELNSPAPTTLLAFRDHESYAPYKTRPDRGSSRILGQFISHPVGNYLTLDAGTELVSSLSVIHHEYVHYFVKHNFPTVPLWFNEGLAEYYSTFATEDEAVLLGGPVSRHMTWLSKHGDFSLDEVLTADTSSAKYHEPGEVGGFYAVSWLMVHYLLSGDAERLERTAEFFALLDEGEEPEDAFEEAFEVRISTLESDLKAHLQEASFEAVRVPFSQLPAGHAIQIQEVAPADASFVLGDLLALLGQRQAAERHFQTALDHHTDHADSLAGMAFLRDLSNRFEEAEILYREAIDGGSVRPQTFYLFGRHLLHRWRIASEPEQKPVLAELSRHILEQAVDLKGDYGEAWALLGSARGIDGGDSAASTRAFEKASHLLPASLPVASQLSVAYARQGRRQAAETILRTIEPRSDAKNFAEVQDEVERVLLLHASQAALEEQDYVAAIEYLDQAISHTRDPQVQEQLEIRLLEMQESFGEK